MPMMDEGATRTFSLSHQGMGRRVKSAVKAWVPQAGSDLAGFPQQKPTRAESDQTCKRVRRHGEPGVLSSGGDGAGRRCFGD